MPSIAGKIVAVLHGRGVEIAAALMSRSPSGFGERPNGEDHRTTEPRCAAMTSPAARVTEDYAPTTTNDGGMGASLFLSTN
jgi:hypothetical protein